jgi:hypothetical protein
MSETLRIEGFRRGLVGGNQLWLALWSVFTTWRVVRRLTGSKPVVERFTLEPGESLLISDLGAPDPSS